MKFSDYAKHLQTHVTDLIKYFDSKHAAVGALSGVFILALLGFRKSVASDLTPLYATMYIASLVAWGANLLIAQFGIFPRLSRNVRPKEVKEPNIFVFTDIARISKASYLAATAAQLDTSDTGDNARSAFSSQLHEICKIADRKAKIARVYVFTVTSATLLSLVAISLLSLFPEG